MAAAKILDPWPISSTISPLLMKCQQRHHMLQQQHKVHSLAVPALASKALAATAAAAGQHLVKWNSAGALLPAALAVGQPRQMEAAAVAVAGNFARPACSLSRQHLVVLVRGWARLAWVGPAATAAACAVRASPSRAGELGDAAVICGTSSDAMQSLVAQHTRQLCGDHRSSVHLSPI